MNLRFWRNPAEEEEAGGKLLDLALSEWRNAQLPQETLSSEAREGILAAFEAGRTPSAIRPLFHPFPRRALVGALGVVAVLVLSFHLGDQKPSRHLGIRAAKSGDEVVFTIAGGRHVVSKSSSPHEFDRHESVRVEGGAFRDRVEDGSDLVFYRID